MKTHLFYNFKFIIKLIKLVGTQLFIGKLLTITTLLSWLVLMVNVELPRNILIMHQYIQ